MRTVGVFYLVWSLSLLAWTAAGVYLMLLSDSMWKIAPLSGWILACTTVAAAFANCGLAAAMIVSGTRPRWTTVGVMAGMIGGLGPCIVRALLPWEDPTTGDGSPLAVLLGIIFMLVIAGGFGIAGIVGLAWVSRIRCIEERRLVAAEFAETMLRGNRNLPAAR